MSDDDFEISTVIDLVVPLSDSVDNSFLDNSKVSRSDFDFLIPKELEWVQTQPQSQNWMEIVKRIDDSRTKELERLPNAVQFLSQVQERENRRQSETNFGPAEDVNKCVGAIVRSVLRDAVDLLVLQVCTEMLSLLKTATESLNKAIVLSLNTSFVNGVGKTSGKLDLLNGTLNDLVGDYFEDSYDKKKCLKLLKKRKTKGQRQLQSSTNYPSLPKVSRLLNFAELVFSDLEPEFWKGVNLNRLQNAEVEHWKHIQLQAVPSSPFQAPGNKAGICTAMGMVHIEETAQSLCICGMSVGSVVIWRVPHDGKEPELFATSPAVDKREQHAIVDIVTNAHDKFMFASQSCMGVVTVWHVHNVFNLSDPQELRYVRKANFCWPWKTTTNIIQLTAVFRVTPEDLVMFRPVQEYSQLYPVTAGAGGNASSALSAAATAGSEANRKPSLLRCAFFPAITEDKHCASLLIADDTGQILKFNIDYAVRALAKPLLHPTSPAFVMKEYVSPQDAPTGMLLINGIKEKPGNHVLRELFHYHRESILAIHIFSTLSEVMVSIDRSGRVAYWRYAREQFKGKCWFRPAATMQLDLFINEFEEVAESSSSSSSSAEAALPLDFALSPAQLARCRCKQYVRVNEELAREVYYPLYMEERGCYVQCQRDVMYGALAAEVRRKKSEPVVKPIVVREEMAAVEIVEKVVVDDKEAVNPLLMSSSTLNEEKPSLSAATEIPKSNLSPETSSVEINVEKESVPAEKAAEGSISAINTAVSELMNEKKGTEEATTSPLLPVEKSGANAPAAAADTAEEASLSPQQILPEGPGEAFSRGVLSPQSSSRETALQESLSEAALVPADEEKPSSSKIMDAAAAITTAPTDAAVVAFAQKPASPPASTALSQAASPAASDAKVDSMTELPAEKDAATESKETQPAESLPHAEQATATPPQTVQKPKTPLSSTEAKEGLGATVPLAENGGQSSVHESSAALPSPSESDLVVNSLALEEENGKQLPEPTPLVKEKSDGAAENPVDSTASLQPKAEADGKPATPAASDAAVLPSSPLTEEPTTTDSQAPSELAANSVAPAAESSRPPPTAAIADATPNDTAADSKPPSPPTNVPSSAEEAVSPVAEAAAAAAEIPDADAAEKRLKSDMSLDEGFFSVFNIDKFLKNAEEAENAVVAAKLAAEDLPLNPPALEGTVTSKEEMPASGASDAAAFAITEEAMPASITDEAAPVTDEALPFRPELAPISMKFSDSVQSIITHATEEEAQRHSPVAAQRQLMLAAATDCGYGAWKYTRVEAKRVVLEIDGVKSTSDGVDLVVHFAGRDNASLHYFSVLYLSDDVAQIRFHKPYIKVSLEAGQAVLDYCVGALMEETFTRPLFVLTSMGMLLFSLETGQVIPCSAFPFATKLPSFQPCRMCLCPSQQVLCLYGSKGDVRVAGYFVRYHKVAGEVAVDWRVHCTFSRPTESLSALVQRTASTATLLDAGPLEVLLDAGPLEVLLEKNASRALLEESVVDIFDELLEQIEERQREEDRRRWVQEVYHGAERGEDGELGFIEPTRWPVKETAAKMSDSKQE